MTKTLVRLKHTFLKERHQALKCLTLLPRTVKYWLLSLDDEEEDDELDDDDDVFLSPGMTAYSFSFFWREIHGRFTILLNFIAKISI